GTRGRRLAPPLRIDIAYVLEICLGLPISPSIVGVSQIRNCRFIATTRGFASPVEPNAALCIGMESPARPGFFFETPMSAAELTHRDPPLRNTVPSVKADYHLILRHRCPGRPPKPGRDILFGSVPTLRRSARHRAAAFDLCA